MTSNPGISCFSKHSFIEKLGEKSIDVQRYMYEMCVMCACMRVYVCVRVCAAVMCARVCIYVRCVSATRVC